MANTQDVVPDRLEALGARLRAVARRQAANAQRDPLEGPGVWQLSVVIPTVLLDWLEIQVVPAGVTKRRVVETAIGTLFAMPEPKRAQVLAAGDAWLDPALPQQHVSWRISEGSRDQAHEMRRQALEAGRAVTLRQLATTGLGLAYVQTGAPNTW